MSTKYFLLTLGIVTVSMLALAACVPATDSGVVTINDDGSTVVAPVTNQNPSNQPGSAEPNAAGGESQIPEQQSGTAIVYRDDTYKFSVTYSSDFVIRTLSAEEIAYLDPKPSVTFMFMNPIAANSNAPEPADLEISVFDPAGITSLDSWLTSVGLTISAKSPQPFNTTHVSGLEVCADTMIAPGCSYFVIANGWIYRMTPASLEGEAMIQSFVPIQ